MFKNSYQQQPKEIRFFLKIVKTLILTIILIVISRVSLIVLFQQMLILQGTPSSVAYQNAQVFVSESIMGQTITSFIDVILILVLVFVSVTHIERREFHLADIGLDLNRNPFPFIAIGLATGSSLFVGAFMLGLFLGTQELPMFPNLCARVWDPE